MNESTWYSYPFHSWSVNNLQKSLEPKAVYSYVHNACIAHISSVVKLVVSGAYRARRATALARYSGTIENGDGAAWLKVDDCARKFLQDKKLASVLFWPKAYGIINREYLLVALYWPKKPDAQAFAVSTTRGSVLDLRSGIVWPVAL